jgi:hypothetical protein
MVHRMEDQTKLNFLFDFACHWHAISPIVSGNLDSCFGSSLWR